MQKYLQIQMQIQIQIQIQLQQCSVVALNQRDGDTLLNTNGVISHASPTTVFIQC